MLYDVRLLARPDPDHRIHRCLFRRVTRASHTLQPRRDTSLLRPSLPQSSPTPISGCMARAETPHHRASLRTFAHSPPVPLRKVHNLIVPFVLRHVLFVHSLCVLLSHPIVRCPIPSPEVACRSASSFASMIGSCLKSSVVRVSVRVCARSFFPPSVHYSACALASSSTTSVASAQALVSAAPI